MSAEDLAQFMERVVRVSVAKPIHDFVFSSEGFAETHELGLLNRDFKAAEARVFAASRCTICGELDSCQLSPASRTRSLLAAAEGLGGHVVDDPRGSSAPVILVDAEVAE